MKYVENLGQTLGVRVADVGTDGKDQECQMIVICRGMAMDSGANLYICIVTMSSQLYIYAFTTSTRILGIGKE